MDQSDATKKAEPNPAVKKTEPSHTIPRRSHAVAWVVAGGVVLLLALIAFLSHRKPPQAETGGRGGRGGGGPIMISTATAQKGDIGVYVNALGTVTPLSTVSVKSRVDGQIVKIYYTEGQLVHEGDPLVDIDPGPFKAAFDQAQGQLARDSALLENARVDLDRYQEAFASNAIPEQQLATQVATVHQYEGTVKLDQGQLDNAKVQLNYSHITAPVTGRVGLRLVDAGNIVHASDTSPLVVITVMQPMTVIFNVAEDYLPQILQQLRQGRELSVDALDRAQQHKLASGTLETLDNQIDPSTGTLKLRAIFPNEDESLFPNQFVNARLLVDTHRDVTLLPNPVIQRNSQGAYVYLVQPEQSATNQNQMTVTNLTITVGTTDGNVSEVEGLEPGATVAADNFNRLIDGAKVTLRSGTGQGQGRRKRDNGGNGSPSAGARNPGAQAEAD